MTTILTFAAIIAGSYAIGYAIGFIGRTLIDDLI